MDKPRMQVGPISILGLLPPERWHAESLAYLDSSAELLEQMNSGSFEPTWPRAKAATFLFGHGLELFFKAAIAQAGEKFLRGHDLAELYAIYQECLPGAEFAFRSNIDVFVKQNEPIPFYDFLKYPERVEQINQTWRADLCIDIADWQQKVLLTAEEARRIWSVVLERFPRDPWRWKDQVDGEFGSLPRKKKAT